MLICQSNVTVPPDQLGTTEPIRAWTYCHSPFWAEVSASVTWSSFEAITAPEPLPPAERVTTQLDEGAEPSGPVNVSLNSVVEPDGLGLGDGEADGLGLGEGEADGLGLGDGLGEGEADGLGLGDGES
ncbi:MAG TPA: hypothetical protein VEY67_11790, partial [Candidatus Dormibacteraeota bacterium]|nr:hypothetical protein [Candidatus Dormibacteraeota bacterium]